MKAIVAKFQILDYDTFHFLEKVGSIAKKIDVIIFDDDFSLNSFFHRKEILGSFEYVNKVYKIKDKEALIRKLTSYNEVFIHSKYQDSWKYFKDYSTVRIIPTINTYYFDAMPKLLKKRDVILTYGTFDMLHQGHLNILRRAKTQGDYLIVGIASDKYITYKGKTAQNTLAERIRNLFFTNYVNAIVIEHKDYFKQWSEQFVLFNAKKIIMGSDHIGEFDKKLKNNPHMLIDYLPRTAGVSTTTIKEELSSGNVGIYFDYKDLSVERELQEIINLKKTCSIIIVAMDNFSNNDELISKMKLISSIEYVNHIIKELKHKDIIKFNAKEYSGSKRNFYYIKNKKSLPTSFVNDK